MLADITDDELLADTFQTRAQKLQNVALYDIDDAIVAAYYDNPQEADKNKFITEIIAPALNEYLERRVQLVRSLDQERMNRPSPSIAPQVVEENQAQEPEDRKPQHFTFPLKTTPEEIRAWIKFHENKTIEAVLMGNAANLQALIDISFVENIYEKSRLFLHEERDKLTEKKIVLEEKQHALKAYKQRGGDYLRLSFEPYYESAKKSAITRLRSHFEGGVDLIDYLSGHEKKKQVAEYMEKIQAWQYLNDSFNPESASNVDKELQQITEGLVKLNGEIEGIESTMVELNTFLFNHADPLGLSLERYIDFLFKNSANFPAADTIRAQDRTVDHLEPSIPQTFREFLIEFRQAETIRWFTEMGLSVPASDLTDERNDLLELEDEFTLKSNLEDEKDQLVSAHFWENLGTYTEKMNAVKLKLKQCDARIDQINDRIAERVRNVSLSLFKENFCKHHAHFISPNFVIPDEVVDTNNAAIHRKVGIGGRDVRDADLILIRGNTLLEVTIRRKYYQLSAWLLLHGADPFKANRMNVSAFHLLNHNDVTGIAVLAQRISDLLNEAEILKISPSERALRYKAARESECLVRMGFESTMTEKHRISTQRSITLQTSKLSRLLRQKLASDLVEVNRVNPSDLMWGSITFRLKWYLGQNVKSFFEIAARLGHLKEGYRDVADQLRNIEATGHDESLIDNLYKIGELCKVTSGYEEIALNIDNIMDTLRQHFKITQENGSLTMSGLKTVGSHDLVKIRDAVEGFSHLKKFNEMLHEHELAEKNEIIRQERERADIEHQKCIEAEAREQAAIKEAQEAKAEAEYYKNLAASVGGQPSNSSSSSSSAGVHFMRNGDPGSSPKPDESEYSENSNNNTPAEKKRLRDQS